MKLRRISRTSTIAWSPGNHPPLIATGTVAGALDASFSTTTELELWDLDLGNSSMPAGGSMSRLAGAKGHVRFNRLAWGSYGSAKPHGIIAGGMEDGQLDLWDPDILLSQSQTPPDQQQDPLILQTAAHTGPVRGLDFNPSQPNLLASAATDGEIFVWDLTNPTRPYSPGNRSARLEDITALSWNRHAAHIMATSSNNGYTVVWDLRNKREVTQLRHLGSGPGGRVPVSGVAWNPDVATQIVTAGDDDISPVILIWDLRNSRAPEKQLMGHSKGILSVSWCPRDSDLLMSSAKDNRTLVWNPSTGDVIGELEQSANWGFDLQWCTRNPDLVAVASFDGKVVVHSLQGTSSDEDILPPSQKTSPTDPFAPAYHQISDQGASSETKFHLAQPPKWMRRPVGATWAFGGRLVTFSKSHTTAPLQPGERRTQPVSIRIVASDPQFAHRLDELDKAMGDAAQKEDYIAFCQGRSADVARNDTDVWKFLRLMFESDARERALTYLGFSRKDVGGEAFRDLVKKLKISLDDDGFLGVYTNSAAPIVPENAKHTSPLAVSPINAEVSPVNEANGVSGLFTESNDDLGIQPAESSSTVPPKPFKLYASTVPSKNEEADVDSLISRAVLLGNYSVAVQACMAVYRYADAMVLAVCGGPDLVAKARDEYFARTRDSKSYMRVLQGVTSSDLKDVVENAGLGESANEPGWKEILALICMYAKPEEFATLFGILGGRLEGIYMYSGTSNVSIPKKASDQIQQERASAAVLCYLSAGNLSRLVEIWASNMAEEEHEYLSAPDASRYSAHLAALQSLIEKVTMYRRAASFIDTEFSSQPSTFKLSLLYDLYADFAEQACAQGRINLAWRFVILIPEGFNASHNRNSKHADKLHYLKDRLYRSGAISSALEAQEPTIPYVFDDVIGRALEAESKANYNSYAAEAVVNTVANQYLDGQQQQYYGGNVEYNSSRNNQYGYNTTASTMPGYNSAASTIPQQQQQWAQPATTSKPAYYGQLPQVQAPPQTTQPQQIHQQPQYGYSQPPPTATMVQAPQPVNSAYQQGALPPSAQKIAPASGFNDLPPGFVSVDSRRSTSKPSGGYTPGFGQHANQMMAGQQIPPTTPQQQPWTATSQPPPPMSNSNMVPPPPTMNSISTMSAPPTMNTTMSNTNPGAPPPTMSQSWSQQAAQQQSLPPPPNAFKPPTPAPPPAAARPTLPLVNPPSAQGIAPSSAVNSPAPLRASQPTPPPPTAASSRHPPGDRSHILPQHMPILNGLGRLMGLMKQLPGPHGKRVAEDTEKRLNTLFDQLNNNDHKPEVTEKLVSLVSALDSKDFAASREIYSDVLARTTSALGLDLSWVPAIKRLIERAAETHGHLAAGVTPGGIGGPGGPGMIPHPPIPLQQPGGIMHPPPSRGVTPTPMHGAAMPPQQPGGIMHPPPTRGVMPTPMHGAAMPPQQSGMMAPPRTQQQYQQGPPPQGPPSQGYGPR
ncbi:hypothetical protein SeLEV6574_g04428 [Synchytrium endobioticum]|uniref:Protein transport protein SEC31 n=1 Tax=Synchytrium endobioticum TaxID=286115 RepID=A0A507CZH4_9FUNG|nr:hypothetical protein SeLEV6574_g04428 [Synchytrium endobioticum]